MLKFSICDSENICSNVNVELLGHDGGHPEIFLMVVGAIMGVWLLAVGCGALLKVFK